MSDINSNKDMPEFSDFLRDLSIELKSESIDDMRQKILVFEKVDEVLALLTEEYGVRVYRGDNVVEEYKMSRQGEIPTTKHALDYILRKDNVEIQIEINFSSISELSIDNQDIQKYHTLLGANSKTEEIIVVWPTDELDSIAFSLDDIQYYQYLWKTHQEKIIFTKENLKPLKDTIVETLNSHRQFFREPTDIREMKRVEFNLFDSLCRIIEADLSELQSSASRKRNPERVQAIRSISEVDKDEILELFTEAQIRDLKIDEIKKRLEKISKKVILDQNAFKE